MKFLSLFIRAILRNAKTKKKREGMRILGDLGNVLPDSKIPEDYRDVSCLAVKKHTRIDPRLVGCYFCILESRRGSAVVRAVVRAVVSRESRRRKCKK